ncbi:hypothetical protein Daus18300_001767 [Diaporthe australafricana]|uniref:Zn(2)-C6 fungal-type domain-containing protein n=1 Tax=Diaporthe australafricana TaxID=127596 RepID=A0ABR3XT66_9PEZI
MPGLTRTRLACDRCHSQKLRCPKQPGSALCTRCLKAGTQCVYSPTGTISTCSHVNGNGNGSTVVRANLMMMDENMEDNGFFDWTTPVEIDFNTLLPPASMSDLQASHEEEPLDSGTTSNDQSTPDLSNSPPGDPIDPESICLSRLTELLLDMGTLWANLPVKTTLHLAQNNSHEQHVKNLTSKLTSKAVLESLFALTQRLIDLYPDAVSLALSPDSRSSSAACEIPDCTHRLELPHGLEEIEKHVSGQQTALHTGLALANVLVSCHFRLLDLLDCFFLLVTSCVRVTVASPDRREPEFDGHDMRVGSFVPPKTAAASMQIALLKHLMVSLSERLASFGVAVSSGTEGPDDSNMELRILSMQHHLLMKRHTSSLGHIDTIEDFIMRYAVKKV